MENVTTQRVNGFRLPHVIRNRLGEELIFESLEAGPNGPRLRVRNAVAPGAGAAAAGALLNRFVHIGPGLRPKAPRNRSAGANLQPPP